MISRLGNFLNRISRRMVPDPFVLALLLSLVVLLAGWTALHCSEAGPGGSLEKLWTGWFDGFSISVAPNATTGCRSSSWV